MRFTHTFIDRPIFATVISILIVLIGAISYFELPVAQYPEIAPPTIQVSASYPGASAEIVANTVATPIEQEINGVEGMLYMLSQSTGDGRLSLTITFALGTDLDEAQVLVQNRVAIAEPRLPETVRRLGVTTKKNSPDLMMVVHLLSPDKSRDALYISNYVKTQILDQLARLDGIGEARIIAERAYSMRVWLNPEKIALYNMTAGEVVEALRKNNLQVASGVIDQMPVPKQGDFELGVRTLGRLSSPSEFENIVIKTDSEGRTTRVRDVGHVELGAQDYSTNGYLGLDQALPIVIFQRPGSNALETANNVVTLMEKLSKSFPDGLAYTIAYNPTDYIAKSVDAVYSTIFEAVILVVLVVIVFLQSWRASIIPILAIPISLIGTFAVMALFGFSINNLTLFGLVLAIGIVVDDAIVVVENVERYLAKGFSPKEAARKTMTEVGGALVAIALVLSAVFIPSAFVPGISGKFYQQFALTIASATIISALVSLTLSPALSSILLKAHTDSKDRKGLLNKFSNAFNSRFDKLANGYAQVTKKLVRATLIMSILYIGLNALTVVQFNRVPTGFIPSQDLGVVLTLVHLPAGASLSRTDQVIRDANKIIMDHPATVNVVAFAGFDVATYANSSSAGTIFTSLAPYSDRLSDGWTVDKIVQDLQARLYQIKDASIIVVQPPPVRGMGNAGGWKAYIQDRGGLGLKALEQETRKMMMAANEDETITQAYTLYDTATPQIYADIDRVKAEMLGVPPERVFEALEVYLGSAFVNDFNFLGRTYRVTAQADGEFRNNPRDITRLRARSDRGAMVPIGAVATFKDQTAPFRVSRYNLYPAAELQGATTAGFSTGQSLEAVERLATENLNNGFSMEWTELALQEKSQGGSGMTSFGLAIVFVFLLLAALYESWLLPLAVILIVPMCLLAAMAGISMRGMDNNILTQIGLIVLIGLAAKNAILIVEFARQLEQQGMDRFQAAIEAARLRLRPILMTSFAFIFGVLPLAIATGAGSEMRQSLGTAVFAGMIGVTLFGLLFTPAFYVICRRFEGKKKQEETP
ncbi:efflux RND transporter permease subunit [Kordiimonas pumila]|uniref:Efflux pump membrane transporter n=1 Tax=Kordiimonas pumila TaxID=2161677 RepID=A0ABV7D350_9PROT|nr:multidrug efflux RND transporter permease subunit [Kordiimonas pumila]